nr:LysR family transcriptional regulator [Eoetvoesiella caeni]
MRTFIAIYETGSLTTTAERLCVTQPTVSYSLSKLRDTLNDPLFLRGSSGMIATASAHECYRRFSTALLAIDDAIETTRRFVPAESTRRFKIAMSDIGAANFLPPIFERMGQYGPRVELEVVQLVADEVSGCLASGKIDAAVGNLASISSLTRHISLFNEHYVCLLSENHPVIKDSLSLDLFLAARHAFVSANYSGHRQVEEALRKAGVMRSVALQIPHFTVLPQLISRSDLLVILPSRVAHVFEAYAPLKTLPVPIEIPSIEVTLHWDKRYENNPAQKWFIDIVRDALMTL